MGGWLQCQLKGRKQGTWIGRKWVDGVVQIFLYDSNLKTNRKNLGLSVLCYCSLSFLRMEN